MKPAGRRFCATRMSDLPPPGPGEVQIRQHAVGVNFLDIYFRTGAYPAPSQPFIPGNEGAGEVVAVGEGVTRFKPGDRVAYAGSLGGYADSAQYRGEIPGVPARRDFLRDRRGDDAQGPDRRISAVPLLQGPAGRQGSGPCGGGRRRADPVPMGAGSRRDGDRHGGKRGQGETGARGGSASHHSLPQ